MSDYLEALRKARRNVQVADHMLTQTYPLVKDPKLLLAVMDNVFLGMSNGMDALLLRERAERAVPPYHNSFDAKFNVLKLRLASKHQLDNSHLILMQDIRSLIQRHKESPVEFARQDKFVICSEEYDLTSVSVGQMKSFIDQARAFLGKVESIITQD